MSVKDTGPGIPEEEIPIVLASFGQGSNSIKSAEQGAGLGLPIAKNLIDLHGGTFTLKSKLRIGTEVIVTFPPERVMSALAPIAGRRRRSVTAAVSPTIVVAPSVLGVGSDRALSAGPARRGYVYRDHDWKAIALQPHACYVAVVRGRSAGRAKHRLRRRADNRSAG